MNLKRVKEIVKELSEDHTQCPGDCFKDENDKVEKHCEGCLEKWPCLFAELSTLVKNA